MKIGFFQALTERKSHDFCPKHLTEMTSFSLKKPNLISSPPPPSENDTF